MVDNYSSLTAHFVNDYFTLTTLVLACIKHEGHTGGLDIAMDLLNSMEEWGLDDEQLVALVSDTEAKMNKAGMTLESEGITEHMYCVAHVLQLTAVLAYEKKTNDGDDMTSVNKLRDLFSYIHKSSQATEKLSKALALVGKNKDLKATTETKTRWGSTYDMIERALDIREGIKAMMNREYLERTSHEKKTDLELLELDDDDWMTLEYLQHLLKPFKEAQTMLEGDKYATK